MMLNKRKISVVGLGKLGLPLAVCFASRGIKTLGVDINEKVVESLNHGISPIVEPQLQEFITKYRKNFRATADIQKAITETDITVILVATPSDPDGNFSNKYVESALKSLAKSLKKSRKEYHLFVISSTVMPGSINKRLIPIIEKYSGRKLNVGFGVGHVPDFVALGSVIRDFLNPDLVIIGESDKFAGDQISGVYGKLYENEPAVTRMPLASAEIAKVALNAYITTKISFANMLANICEKIPGADVDLITKGIGADRRISPYYFKGGLSFGGTCFPRDTKSFMRFAGEKKSDAGLIKEVEKINRFQDDHLADLVLRNLPKNRRVSVLGLSFKPNTPVIIESPAIKLIKFLLTKGVKVTAYDSLAKESVKEIFKDKIEYADSLKECLSRSDLWVITLPSEEFKSADYKKITKKPVVIIDCWRILKPNRLPKNVKHIKWGYYQK
ncbi:MAG: nucleotide sugar dehydrogenase [Patescibacteria group bacterium]